MTSHPKAGTYIHSSVRLTAHPSVPNRGLLRGCCAIPVLPGHKILPQSRGSCHRTVSCNHSPAHGHSHSHCTEHDPVHHHHHYPNNHVTRALDKLGLVSLASDMEHSPRVALASIACFALACLFSLEALQKVMSTSVCAWVQNISLSGTMVLSGIPQLVESLTMMGDMHIDTHVLMSLAVGGTLYMGMAHEAALLLLLFRTSHFLEEKFAATATGGLSRLFASVPQHALLVELDEANRPVMATAKQVPAQDVALGQHILVKPGQKVPLDGCIVHGSAQVTLQHITGESQPVAVSPGSNVAAGSTNTDGLLVMVVTARQAESTPARIARMTAQAQASKPRLQRQLDRISKTWATAVIAATLATMAILPLLGIPFWGNGGAFYRSMGVLTAGSPCALVLVPLAYVCAIARVSARGVLLKSSAVLDRLAASSVVALDKTGTLTLGALTLSDAYVLHLGPQAPSAQQPTPVSMAPTDGPHTDPLLSSSSSSSSTPLQSPSTSLRSPSPASLRSASPSSSAMPIPTPQASSSLESSPTASLTSDSESGSNSDAPSSSAQPRHPLMNYAIALSQLSSHPVSNAMVQADTPSSPDAPPHPEVGVQDFKQVSGCGVQGMCTLPANSGTADCGSSTRLVRFGSRDWIRNALVDPALQAGLDSVLEKLGVSQRRATAFVMVSEVDAVGEEVAGGGCEVAMFCFDDGLQQGVGEAVNSLVQGSWQSGRPAQHACKHVVMLTGDNAEVAAAIASQVGITDVQASLRPEHKLEYVKAAQAKVQASQQGGVVMVGDGINDAPALAAAHVGVAVAHDVSDMAAAAADVIVLNGQGVRNLPWLFKVADETQVVVKQNLVLALAAVVAATIPTVAGLFPLWLAVLLHEGSTLLVALNSLRLLMDRQTSGGLGATLRQVGIMMSREDAHHHHHHHHHHGAHGHEHIHSHDHHHHHHHTHDHGDTHGHDDHHHHSSGQPQSTTNAGAHAHTHSHDHHECTGHEHQHEDKHVPMQTTMPASAHHDHSQCTVNGHGHHSPEAVSSSVDIQASACSDHCHNHEQQGQGCAPASANTSGSHSSHNSHG